MLISPERYRKEVGTIQNFTSWELFMRAYFQSILVKDFPGEYRDELRKANAPRLNNPDYLRFSALVYGNAATLGLVEAAGGAARHKYRRFSGSYTDPIHLLALDGYLAKLNLETARKKKQIARSFEVEFNRALNPLELERVWGIVPDISGGIVNEVIRPRNLRQNAPRTRVCIPDLQLLKQISQIDISGEKAGVMTAGEFAVTQLPFVEKIYGGLVNVHKVFFGPGEKWAT